MSSTRPKNEFKRLRAEAARRACAGERPADICAGLGISKAGFYDWARRDGFRLCDLSPLSEATRGRTPIGLATDKTDRKRVNAYGFVEAAGSAADVLAAVYAALERGDQREADLLLRAWRAKARRGKTLDVLEGLADDAAAMAGQLPSDWVPGEAVTLAQLWAMDGYDCYRHVCALCGEVAVAREDWQAAQAEEAARPGEALTPEDELFEAALAQVRELAAGAGWT